MIASLAGRGQLGAGQTETPLTPTVLGQGGMQLRRGEVRPEDF